MRTHGRVRHAGCILELHLTVFAQLVGQAAVGADEVQAVKKTYRLVQNSIVETSPLTDPQRIGKSERQSLDGWSITLLPSRAVDRLGCRDGHLQLPHGH